MRHHKHTVKFGRQRSHLKATLRHLVSSLIINKRIITTKTRAKETSMLAEKLVTIGKENCLANQRKAYSILRNRDLVSILFNEISPLFNNRNGGYTRIILTGRRRGDNAQMAILEFVEKPKKKEPPKEKPKKKEKKELPKPKVQKERVIEEKEEPEKEIKPPIKEPERPQRPEEKEKPGFFKRFRLFRRRKDKEK